MSRVGRELLALVAAAAFSGCGGYQPPPLSAAHPAHPDAPAARPWPGSQTLAYTRSDADAVSAATAPASGRGAHTGAGRPMTTVVGEGEVVATTPSSGQIVVDHGEIKGFMEAMTMGYRIEPPSLLGTVTPGDRIRFTIDVDRRAIVQIEKLK